MLETCFADQNEAGDARYRFQHHSQGEMSVLDYSNTLDRLLATPGLEDQRADVNVLHRFLSGMQPALSTLLIPTEHTFVTKADALALAIKFERMLARSSGAEEMSQPLQQQQHQHFDEPAAGFADVHRSRAGGNRTQSRERPSGSTRGNAATSHRQQHHSNSQAPGQSEPVLGRDGKLYPHVQCNICQRYGHYKRSCPARLPGHV